MKAARCEIIIGGVTVLTATDLDHRDTKKVLGGLGGVIFEGAVGQVKLSELAPAMAAELAKGYSKDLKIKLSFL
jgi:hypothetical protein